jgi:glycerol-3-phosphate O-acyltransferase
MTKLIEMPLWVLLLLMAFATVTFASHFLFPSVRWFFRRRMERAVAKLNERLERPIQPFKLMRRQDMIMRLLYDPKVMEAVVEYAREQQMPESVAFQQARSYAREIVPGFSTAAYFGFAIRVARKLSRGLYKVRLGHFDAAALKDINQKAAVIFVMNHRSNMDYVLVTWLAAEQSALSYAVGEWGRVWPLQGVIRAMGAYFIRRRYLSPLYRRVLARYVQIATHEGVTQAIFPEGGLSLDGQVGPAKKGLLNYIVSDFNLDGGRDVVFIPVALNYDRVLEDRLLIAANKTGIRRFKARWGVVFRFIFKHWWLHLRGKFNKFGYAAVCYGEPVSLEAFLRATPNATTDMLSSHLMQRISASIPVLPVPFVAALINEAGGKTTRTAIAEAARAMIGQLQARNAQIHLPDGEIAAAIEEGIDALSLRNIISIVGETVSVTAENEASLAFYAASVQQLLEIPPQDGAKTTHILTLRAPVET